MMPSVRPSAPASFAANAERWQKQHDAALLKNPQHRFTWYRTDDQDAREIALLALRAMTEEHCSYCDGYHIWDLGETIDHFRPKRNFPAHAYDWANLFLACGNCQKRGEKYDEKLLRPDDPAYAFEHYFEFDYPSGKLRIATLASELDRLRAEVTIDLFDLNHPERCKARLRALERLRGAEPQLSRPYRFIVRPPPL